MTLKKLTFKPGVNRENTRYTNENGWYESDKVRFRQGTPEKIGGWQRISSSTYNGVCRSLLVWGSLGGNLYTGVGTNTQFCIESGGSYFDITPIRSQRSLANAYLTSAGTSLVSVTDGVGGYNTGDFVYLYPAITVGGITVFGWYQITVLNSIQYQITVSGTASSTAVSVGTANALYEINSGAEYASATVGWGAGVYGGGGYGIGTATAVPMRLWSESNFGDDLIFGYRGGPIYYWDASIGVVPQAVTFTVASPTVVTLSSGSVLDGQPVMFLPAPGVTMPTGVSSGVMYYARDISGSTFRIAATAGGAAINVTVAASGTVYVLSNATPLSSYGGSIEVPIAQNYLLVSDIYKFVFALGCNAFGSTTFDPMLIRWSDKMDPFNWLPDQTNEAGYIRLSRGSEIVTAQQARQEILIWTDSSVYSFQYSGAPIGWVPQLVGDNISIVGQNAVAYANGTAFWMGRDKFYKYDGTTAQLRCDLRKFIFENINTAQYDQVFAGTNEGFNEVWWFYCTANSTRNNAYVVYNYVEDAWYYGTMARTAWVDSGLRDYPMAATYSNNLVNHEQGTDDNESATTQPITAYIVSAELDLDDGHNFMFIWRVLPDISFANSTIAAPQATMYLLPMQNSGSGYNVNKPTNENHSVANSSSSAVIGGALLPIEEFTGQVYTRVRGRQLAIKVESSAVGVQWQLGSPRIDMRPDGRR